MTTQFRCAFILFLGYLLGSCQCSYAEEPDARFAKTSQDFSEKQTKKIQQELSHLKSHDWAGEYYFGDGLGVNVDLVLAPANGFVFTWNGCLGLYDLNYGDVAFTNGTVKLLFRFPNKRKGVQGTAPELLPVRWGERHYLLPKDQVVDFTNAINAGTEPDSLFGGRSTRFLLRRGDEKKPVSALPSLPAEFLSYILPEPIKAKIRSVDQPSVEKDRRHTHVRIDIGSASGLKKGMELYVQEPSGIFATAIVTDVFEREAAACIEQWELSEPPPSTGWELSTKM